MVLKYQLIFENSRITLSKQCAQIRKRFITVDALKLCCHSDTQLWSFVFVSDWQKIWSKK